MAQARGHGFDNERTRITFFLPVEHKGHVNAVRTVINYLQGGYELSLIPVAATDDLPKDGRNLVIVALVGYDLHIRIFDASGNKVIDKGEKELVSGATLNALKKRFPVPDVPVLSKGNKQKILIEATSIAGLVAQPDHGS